MPKNMKNPAGLLCVIGALDKFSFNGIRALLVLYLSQAFLFSDERAYQLYGSVMALSFITPLLGGYLSDCRIGGFFMLLGGTIFSLVGVGLLLVPQTIFLYVGLALVIMGSGFIKSVIPSLLSQVAEKHHLGRDSIYAGLYTSFNVGTALGTLGCAVAGEVFGWQYSFLAAGLVCALSAILILRSRPDLASLAGSTTAVQPNEERPPVLFLGLACLIPLLALLIREPELLHPLLLGALFISLGAMFWFAYREGKVFVVYAFELVGLMAVHAVFFALYEQGALSLSLFAARNVHRTWSELIPGLGGQGTVPIMFFQLIDPVLNFLLGGSFVFIWSLLERKRLNPTPIVKFGFALVMIGFGFSWLASGSQEAALISPWRLIATYLFFVIGEQCAVPIGLSAVSRLAPKKYVSVFMGVWFLSIGLSMWLASYLSSFAAVTVASDLTSASSLKIYQTAFSYFTQLAAGLGIVILGCAAVKKFFLSSPLSLGFRALWLVALGMGASLPLFGCPEVASYGDSHSTTLLPNPYAFDETQKARDLTVPMEQFPLSVPNLRAAHRLSYYAYYTHHTDSPTYVWESPAQRAVMDVETSWALTRKKRKPEIKRAMEKLGYRITVDKAFAQVVKNCASMERFKKNPDGSWQVDENGERVRLRTTFFTDKMIHNYVAAHEQGLAHAIEVWDREGQLVGGAVILAIDGAVSGESLFHNAPSSGVAAMAATLQWLKEHKITWIDAQVVLPGSLTESLGGYYISREDYLARLAVAHGNPMPLAVPEGEISLKAFYE